MGGDSKPAAIDDDIDFFGASEEAEPVNPRK